MSVETLVLPSEMVAESVVNSIQTNTFDAHEDDASFVIQATLALSLGNIFHLGKLSYLIISPLNTAVVLTTLFVIMIVFALRRKQLTGSVEHVTRSSHVGHVAQNMDHQTSGQYLIAMLNHIFKS